MFLSFSKALAFSLIFFSYALHAESESSISTDVLANTSPNKDGQVLLLGHNVTPTTYTLNKGHITAGSYALAYGLTDSWTIGTSPWLDFFYNMPTLNTRFLFFERGNFRFGGDASYFKTFHFGNDYFQQESTFERLTVSQNVFSLYTIHASIGYQYFWDETTPFSLRLIPGNGDRYNTSVGTLHEFRWFSHVGTLFELGVIGLNYVTPYLHLGASIYANWNWGSVQFGLSRSSSMGIVHSVSATEDFYYIRHIVYHPELQIQAFF